MAKVRKNKGWFYIRPNRKPDSWSLYYECFENGVRQKPEKVSSIAFTEYGLRSDMTTEEARKRVIRLNKERKLEKDTIRRSANNLEEIQSLDKLFFPQDLVDGFFDTLENESFSSSPIHKKKLISHFNFIQIMVVGLKLNPRKYKEKSKSVYRYLLNKKVSVDYAKKLIGFLNRWGRYVSAIEGSYFESVKPPMGDIRSSIAEAQKTKKGKNSELGVRTASLPLTPEILKKTKNRFTQQEHYNWLMISMWFGLRPAEVDVLRNNKLWELSKDKNTGVHVLSVYQSKLRGLREEDRYKHIPILFEEQHGCVEIINSGQFKRPHSKTVRKHISDGTTLYGGRKGFVDLMLTKGQKVEDISIWLGHTSIETTWKHYKDRKKIRFTSTNEIVVEGQKPNIKRVG